MAAFDRYKAIRVFKSDRGRFEGSFAELRTVKRDLESVEEYFGYQLALGMKVMSGEVYNWRDDTGLQGILCVCVGMKT